MELLSLQEIAERLNMPPSTVRYYRNKYKDFMPEVAAGRYKKFQPEAVEIIKFIAAATTATKQQQEIKELLSAKFALNIDKEEEGESTAATATTTAATKQQQTFITIYENHITDLNSQIAFLQEELIYKDSVLLQVLKQLEQARRPWWKRGKS